MNGTKSFISWERPRPSGGDGMIYGAGQKGEEV